MKTRIGTFFVALAVLANMVCFGTAAAADTFAPADYRWKTAYTKYYNGFENTQGVGELQGSIYEGDFTMVGTGNGAAFTNWAGDMDLGSEGGGKAMHGYGYPVYSLSLAEDKKIGSKDGIVMLSFDMFQGSETSFEGYVAYRTKSADGMDESRKVWGFNRHDTKMGLGSDSSKWAHEAPVSNGEGEKPYQSAENWHMYDIVLNLSDGELSYYEDGILIEKQTDTAFGDVYGFDVKIGADEWAFAGMIDDLTITHVPASELSGTFTVTGIDYYRQSEKLTAAAVDMDTIKLHFSAAVADASGIALKKSDGTQILVEITQEGDGTTWVVTIKEPLSNHTKYVISVPETLVSADGGIFGGTTEFPFQFGFIPADYRWKTAYTKYYNGFDSDQGVGELLPKVEVNTGNYVVSGQRFLENWSDTVASPDGGKGKHAYEDPTLVMRLAETDKIGKIDGIVALSFALYQKDAASIGAAVSYRTADTDDLANSVQVWGLATDSNRMGLGSESSKWAHEAPVSNGEGEKPYQSAENWHMYDIVLNLSDGELSYYEDGNLIETSTGVVFTDFYGFDLRINKGAGGENGWIVDTVSITHVPAEQLPDVYEVKGVSITKDGVVISNTQGISAGDKITAKLEYVDTTSETHPYFFVLAVYQGDMLTNCYISQSDIMEKGAGSDEITCTITDMADLRIKAFVWDSAAGMEPLCAAAECAAQ